VTNSALYSRIPCRLVTKEGQRNSRIAPDVLDLLVHSQMAHHELFALNLDPHYGDLGATVGIGRGQMSEWSFFDHVAYCLWNLHGCLSFDAFGAEPRRSCNAKHEKHDQRLLMGDIVLVVANEPGDALKQTTHGQL
jgi:hypothetical protein